MKKECNSSDIVVDLSCGAVDVGIKTRFDGNAGGDLHHVHTQLVPEREWHIRHGLGKYPSVTVVDSAGTEVCGDVSYVDKYNVIVSFQAAFSGKAYMN